MIRLWKPASYEGLDYLPPCMIHIWAEEDYSVRLSISNPRMGDWFPNKGTEFIESYKNSPLVIVDWVA